MTDEKTETPDEKTETPATEAATPQAVDEVPTAVIEPGLQASNEDDDDTENDDTEGDEEKDDKPKKVKINFEASMPRGEAVSYFEAIVGGLKSGRLEFRQEGDTLVLNPPEQLEIEVKASRKGDKGKVVFEIEWSDENRSLEILN